MYQSWRFHVEIVPDVDRISDLISSRGRGPHLAALPHVHRMHVPSPNARCDAMGYLARQRGEKKEGKLECMRDERLGDRKETWNPDLQAQNAPGSRLREQDSQIWRRKRGPRAAVATKGWQLWMRQPCGFFVPSPLPSRLVLPCPAGGCIICVL